MLTPRARRTKDSLFAHLRQITLEHGLKCPTVAMELVGVPRTVGGLFEACLRQGLSSRAVA